MNFLWSHPGQYPCFFITIFTNGLKKRKNEVKSFFKIYYKTHGYRTTVKSDKLYRIYAVFERNWVLGTKSNVLIPKSLQPDGETENYDYLIQQILYIENRINREEFTGNKCKTTILMYCFHTAGVLQIFMLYNLLGPGISFDRKSKIIVKRKPNYEIGWFHNWPMIISHRLYAFHFTNDDFPL